MQHIITLLTDFGADGTYAAQMKGAILKRCPPAVIVDITHASPPQDIQFAARVLADVYRYFPERTVHIVVVDPGVGTRRRILVAECDGHLFIAPDNGLLTSVIENGSTNQVVTLTNQEYWSDRISSTFHGRDIMAPVAAHLANGMELSRLGNPVTLDSLQRATISQPKMLAELVDGEVIAGEIIAVDSFGNLISNIHRRHLSGMDESATIRVSVGDLLVEKLVTSYGFAKPGAIVALFGSADYLEIAQVNGHAANTTGQGRGATVCVGYAH